MNQIVKILFPTTLILMLSLTGCGKNAEGDVHDHSASEEEEGHGHADEHGHEGGEEAGASFTDGKGLLVGDEAQRQFGLETADVTEQKLTVQFDSYARVYETAHAHSQVNELTGTHDSHATAILSTHMASYLTAGQSVQIESPDGSWVQGRLNRLDAESTKAIGQVEAIIDVPDPEHLHEFGTFAKVRFSGGEREVTAIPKSALLEAATGTFVFVKNGDYLLRTPVTAGASSEHLIEITDGLFEGDVIATVGAVDLWLIELRFTKGGGHSH